MSNPYFNMAERRIFAAVVGAATGVPAQDDVADAITPWLDRLPPRDRRSLRGVLRLLEHVAPRLGGARGRYSSLDAGRRESILARWATSRLKPLRTAASVLRVLAALAQYGRDAAWAGIGYDGPWLGRIDVPVLPVPNPPTAPAPDGRSEMSGSGITRGREVRGDLHLRARTCVIGLGAGGAAAFARLAGHGVDVIAVEAGGIASAADYTQREHEMLPRLYRDAGLRATADRAIGILQGRGIGGSTLHNTGLVYTPPEAILERWREEHGFSIPADTLDRCVADAMTAVGARPITEDWINANNDALRRGAERLGWRYRIAMHNRVACSGCGYCMLGCAYNRKTNAALAYVPRALAAGGRILSDATVTRIASRPDAWRVICELVDAAGRPTGRRATIEVETVVVAAGALDTPALLRRSGLGGRRVGHGLRLHPAATVSAFFPHRIEAWRGLPQSVLVEEFASFFDNGRGGFLLVPNAATTPGLTAAIVPGIGPAHRAVMRDYARLATASVLLHDESAGRVTAGADGRPVARYWPSPSDMGGLLRGLEALGRIFLAAGAERVYLPIAGAPPVRTDAELAAAIAATRPAPHRITLNSVHPQGSCPMGDDRRRSVVDPNGQLRGEPGIYLCDASIFPTSIGVPPQITIMTLAAAVADASIEGRS